MAAAASRAAGSTDRRPRTDGEEPIQTQRLLVRAVFLLVALTVVAGAALGAVVVFGGSGRASPRDSAYERSTRAVDRSRHSEASSRAPAGRAKARASTPTSTTTPASTSASTSVPTVPATRRARVPRTGTSVPTTAPSTVGGPPVLTALTPSSISNGGSVVVTGSGFLSPDGEIVADVAGQPVPTSCPNQSTCDITVPAPAAGQRGSVPVTVTTEAGTSNALELTYGT